MPSKNKSQHHRDKIRASVILERLDKHATGELEMTPTQVRAAEILLKKAVPDLATVTLQGDEDGGPVGILFKTVYESTDR